jgi:hypothetical protein
MRNAKRAVLRCETGLVRSPAGTNSPDGNRRPKPSRQSLRKSRYSEAEATRLTGQRVESAKAAFRAKPQG